MAKRKAYSGEFKFKIAKEAIKDDNIVEIARKYNLGPTVVSEWKKILPSHSLRSVSGGTVVNKIKIRF